MVMKNRLDTIFAALLFGCFFLPWSKFFALQGSGFDLAVHPELDAAALFVIPALALLVIATGLLGKFNTRWLQVFVGLVPVLGLIGGILHFSHQTGASPGDAFATLKTFIGWGVYASIGAGLLLSLNGFFQKPKPKAKADQI